MKPKVALVKGGNRAENIDRSLRLLGDEINLKGKKNVLVKVNFSSRDNQLGATHVNAVRALLKFLRNVMPVKSRSPNRHGVRLCQDMNSSATRVWKKNSE